MDLKDELIKSQIEKSIDGLQTQYTMLAQITTILVIGDVTIVGFAIDHKSAGLFFIGIIFPIAIIIVFNTIRRLMIPVAYVVMNLENKVDGKIDWLVSTYVRFMARKKYLTKLLDIGKIENIEDRVKELKRINSLMYGTYAGWLFIVILILITLGHIIIPFLFIKYLNWNL